MRRLLSAFLCSFLLLGIGAADAKTPVHGVTQSPLGGGLLGGISRSASCSPNPNGNGIGANGFVDGCILPAAGLNISYGEVMQVPNNAALQSLARTGSFLPTYVLRQGFTTAGDGGDALYSFSSTNCPSADNGDQVSAAGSGCWNIVKKSAYDVRIWGAKCDNSTDDTAAINAAGAFSPSVLFPSLTFCKTTGTLTPVWQGFGTPSLVIGSLGVQQNAILGYVNNTTPSSTLGGFPTGVTGYGRLAVGANGNEAFGVFGLCEFYATGGGVCPAAEVTARNFSGNNPDISLPPNTAFGTTTTVATGLNVTAGTEVGTKDDSIGIDIANESGSFSNPVFNTGIFINFYRQYGLFIAAQPSGTQTSAMLQNNGLGKSLQVQYGASGSATSTVSDLANDGTLSHFNVRQNGDFFSTGRVEFSQPSRPVVSACGTSPLVNTSTDQAGIITVGSGTVTSCTVTFSRSFNNIPVCVVTPEYVGTVGITSKSVASFSVGSPINFAGNNFDYVCMDEN